MYNPISTHVIKQSLWLSRMPQPIHIHRLDQVKFPTDTVVTAYRCVFPAVAVFNYIRVHTSVHPQEGLLRFVRYLNECFCSDIFATDWDYDEYDDTVSVTICTRLVEHEGVQ